MGCRGEPEILHLDYLDAATAKLHWTLAFGNHNRNHGRMRKAILVYYIMKIKLLRQGIAQHAGKVRPLDFLLLQLHSYTALLASSLDRIYLDGGYLQFTFQDLLHYASNQFKQLRFELGSPKRFSIAIDEAQVFVDCLPHYVITSNGNPKHGALLSTFLWVTSMLFPTKDYIFITSGTGFSADHTDLYQYQSAIRRLVFFEVKVKVKALGADLIRSANDAIKFLELHINLPDSCREWMLSKEFCSQYLPIRIRILTRVLFQMIAEPKYDLNSDLIYFQESFSSAISATVENLQVHRGAAIEAMLKNPDIKNNLLKLIWKHFTGEQQILTSESLIKLITTGNIAQ